MTRAPVGIVIVFLAGGGCRTPGTPPALAAPVVGPAARPAVVASDPGVTLAAAAAGYWEARLEADPLEATEIGDRRFDDRLPDLSPEARDREMTELRALRGQVEGVPPTALPNGDRITRALLLGEIDADLARGECKLDDWSVDARDGLQVALQRLPELQPVHTVTDGRTMVARWGRMGATIDQETANLRRGLAAGKVATAEEIGRVLGQLDALAAKPMAEWTLRGPAARPHPDWSPAEQAIFVAGIDAALATGVRPAFERQRDVLRQQILPHARDQAHAGILNVPGGAACYAHLIKVHTSLDLSAEEIHRIGLEELARIHTEMSRLGELALGTGALPEIRRRLRADPAMNFRTGDEILTAARGALARSQAAEPRFLGKAPNTTCVVKPIEAFEEKDAPIAYYRPAAVDGSRPGAYFVNTSEPTTRARYDAEALAFHESVPGHHIQIAIAQELSGLPEFRKHAGVTAFVEGWGLYAEGLADELGLYSSALERLGRLNFDAWRACRLVVDTGIHALGWTRAQAIAFMQENAVMADNNIVNEVDRYIAWPGQALAYKIGEREIRRLRASAESRLGARFDLRTFHDVLLGGGGVSLPVLREEIERWISATEAAGNLPAAPRP